MVRSSDKVFNKLADAQGIDVYREKTLLYSGREWLWFLADLLRREALYCWFGFLWERQCRGLLWWKEKNWIVVLNLMSRTKLFKQPTNSFIFYAFLWLVWWWTEMSRLYPQLQNFVALVHVYTAQGQRIQSRQSIKRRQQIYVSLQNTEMKATVPLRGRKIKLDPHNGRQLINIFL